jgi:hypothetical protein
VFPLKNTTKVVSILHLHVHFVAMEMEIQKVAMDMEIEHGYNKMVVFDGYKVDKQEVRHWIPHAIYVLKRACIMPWTSTATFKKMPGLNPQKHLSLNLPSANVELMLDVFMEQNDGNNCGPIAGLKLVDSYNLPEKLGGTQGTYHDHFVFHYRNVLAECTNDIDITVSKQRHEEEEQRKRQKTGTPSEPAVIILSDTDISSTSAESSISENSAAKKPESAAEQAAAAEEQEKPESAAAQAAAAEEQEMSGAEEKETPNTLALAKAEHAKRLYAKSQFRSLQRNRMRSARKKDVLKRTARVGNKVNVAIDKRDVHGAQGLIVGIVFRVSQAGGCRIVTKHSILGYDKKQGTESKRKFYIPIDQYKLLEDDAPVHEELETIPRFSSWWKVRRERLRDIDEETGTPARIQSRNRQDMWLQESEMQELCLFKGWA